ncbi:eukaryotic translation initiation factor 4E, variant 2 [Batrachochytrium dendrobatidis]|nr:eukaryotic translation initiation factor 4E, variant 2 [Batrachochytrium dendrobatidis]
MAAADDETQSVEQAVEEQVTAFDDIDSMTVKHPLQSAWTLWFDSPNKKSSVKEWSSNLKEIISFDTVEDFWGVINNVIGALDIPLAGNYHLFRKGIEPAWEDKANSKGGKWSFAITKQRRVQDLDKFWLNTMMAVIGEQFTYSDEITGIVVSNRRAHDRISVWTRDAEDREKCLKIGEELKKFLPTTEIISYLSHSDPQKKKSSFNSDKYTI